MSDPATVAVVGDTHGRMSAWTDEVRPVLKATGIRSVWQVGDIEHYPYLTAAENRAYIADLDSWLEEEDLVCHHIGGNHDDPALRFLRPGKLVQRGERLFYIPQGHRWSLCDTRFLGLGGAFSVDLDPDQPQPWAISAMEVAQTLAGGPADIAIFHSCLAGPDLESLYVQVGEPFIKGDPGTKLDRHYLRRVVNVVKPSLVLHGHFHNRYCTKLVSGIVIEGLACNGRPGLIDILDVRQRRLRHITLPIQLL